MLTSRGSSVANAACSCSEKTRSRTDAGAHPVGAIEMTAPTRSIQKPAYFMGTARRLEMLIYLDDAHVRNSAIGQDDKDRDSRCGDIESTLDRVAGIVYLVN